jgi:hypothetical protein
MPLTYVAHQVPVLAMKLGRPRWFDGTALALGSMAPDWTYALVGTGLYFNAHAPIPLLLFCVPAATGAALVVRRTAPTAAAYLPEPPGLPLRRLRLINAHHPPLAMTVTSALLGALTHVGWDSFTHAGRWGARAVPWLRDTHQIAGHAVAGSSMAQQASTVLGFLAGVLLLAQVLRRLPRWTDAEVIDAPPTEGAGLFWTATAVGAAVGVVWGVDAGSFIAGAVVRCSLGIAAGALVGVLLARRKPRWSGPRTRRRHVV